MQQTLLQLTPPCACASGNKPQLCGYSLPAFSGLHSNGKLSGSARSNRIFQRHHHSQALSISRSTPGSAISISCKVATISHDSFTDEVINSDVPVLVGFCADWCGPCKLIGPIMDSVTKDFEGKLKAVKIDTDSCPDLVKEYDVYGLPTLIVFKDGKAVPKSRTEGTITAKKLKELLDEVLTTATSA